MTRTREVTVVTGNRAEYGLLRPVLRALSSDVRFSLRLIATGSHLSAEFGHTVDEIEADGFRVDQRLDMLVSGDSPAATTKSIGLGVIAFADAFQRHRPDWLLVLGDRYEVFAAAQAALIARIPIAHIAGGDTTEGAFDEALRHGITKMAHLHFATNELSARRIRQMGEDPASVHVVGSPGIDAIRELRLLDRDALVRELGVRFRAVNLLVTYHPATLNADGSHDELQAILNAIATRGPETAVFLTRPNADTGGRAVSALIDEWAAVRDNVSVFTSLGSLRYLSLVQAVDVVVGNSSSGLYEAPSLGTPTVDVGNRQRGRLAAASVIRAGSTPSEIAAAIERALALDMSPTVNPYGDGQATPRIVSALAAIEYPSRLLMKRFHLLPGV